MVSMGTCMCNCIPLMAQPVVYRNRVLLLNSYFIHLQVPLHSQCKNSYNNWETGLKNRKIGKRNCQRKKTKSQTSKTEKPFKHFNRSRFRVYTLTALLCPKVKVRQKQFLWFCWNYKNIYKKHGMISLQYSLNNLCILLF